MDTLSQARRLLDAVGPGRMLLVGPATERLAIELRRLGCETHPLAEQDVLTGQRLRDRPAFDTIVWAWRHGAGVPAPAALAKAMGSERWTLALVRDPAQPAPDAATLQHAAFEQGWRRSLCDWSPQHYVGLDRPNRWSELYLEPLPGVEREPEPIDPTRTLQPRADALLARYAQAAEQIRPGDHVLVIGCGSGAGAALLAQRSRCAAVTALDPSAAAIDYAKRHFALDALVRFEVCAHPFSAAPVAPRSIDVVVAIDAFDGADDPQALADECVRVLKPDGRVFASLAQADAAQSMHAQSVEALLGARLLIESRLHQPVPGADARLPRVINRIEASSDAPAGGWRLVVAAANPLGADRAGFSLPEFAPLEGPPVPVTDFAGHYDNPWLYRPMVQMGQRLKDEALLTDLALAVVGQSDAASADHGAALCVLAYQVLGRRRADQVGNLLPLIDAYVALESANPHVRRWQLSLDYAAALACLMTGDLGRAQAHFECVTQRDPLAFSPLLSTKVVAASFWLGVRRLVARDAEGARLWFQAGVAAAARALKAPIEASISSLARPNTFGFQELAEVADMASQCAQALAALDLHAVAPGRFWRQVDTRRFGLATWLLHLERENEELRQRLQAGAISHARL
jgi:SAM-dependent methyltransferase